jgi:hypothetical protein
VAAARRLTSLLVRNFWTPVGVTVRGDPAMRRVCAYLFPGDRGVERLGAVDRSIARLPGLEWFDLGARYARRVQASGPRICFPAQARSASSSVAWRLREFLVFGLHVHRHRPRRDGS